MQQDGGGREGRKKREANVYKVSLIYTHLVSRGKKEKVLHRFPEKPFIHSKQNSNLVIHYYSL